MEILNLEGTEDTPKIILDKKNGIFEISGRSLPEDSAEFYRPVLEWIGGYAKEPNGSTEFVFKLEYFNTASSKLILDEILGIKDLRSDKRIDFVGGIRGLGELKRRVDDGEMKVALALYPVSMNQLIAIADSGNIMPPKTTWFEPKLRSGLIIHKLV